MLIVATLWAPAAAHAQPVELKLARVLSWQKKYDEALARYRAYLAAHPSDTQAHLEMGDICFWTKDYDCARAEYEKARGSPKLAAVVDTKMALLAEAAGDLPLSAEYLEKALEADPGNAELRLKLARFLAYDKRYDESIAAFDRVIATEPGNAAALAERADVLSWQERYTEAIAGYDAALALRFDPEVARQKARVLGWWKKFGRALTTYDDAFTQSGLEAIALERKAKQAFWNRWVLTSLKRYRELLAIEPKNVEARFDLGQVEGTQRMWHAADDDFRLILADQPWHFRAADGLDLEETLRTKRTLVPQVSWFRARSNDRATHINRLTARADVTQPIVEGFSAVAGYAFDEFLFHDGPSISRHQGRIGVDAWLAPYLWGSAFYLPTGYPYQNRMSQLWEGEISARPVDPITVTAFTRRDDLFNQRLVFEQELHTTDVGARVRADIHRRWVSSVDYQFSWINDTNKRAGIGANQIVYLSYEPYRLTLDGRFEFFDYRRATPSYWSPQNYWSTSATLHWRHYFNPHGMYYGALERYYGIKYRFQIDRGVYPYNGGAIEFHYDWNHRFGLNVEAQGGKSSVYYDAGALLSLTGRF